MLLNQASAGGKVQTALLAVHTCSRAGHSGQQVAWSFQRSSAGKIPTSGKHHGDGCSRIHAPVLLALLLVTHHKFVLLSVLQLYNWASWLVWEYLNDSEEVALQHEFWPFWVENARHMVRTSLWHIGCLCEVICWFRGVKILQNAAEAMALLVVLKQHGLLLGRYDFINIDFG